MANSGGKIYVDTSVTPNVGISISDIQTVLGYPRHPVTGDVINDIGGLITYGDIKEWSWHKPVRQHSFGYDMRSLPAGDDGFNGDQPIGEYCIGSLEIPFSQRLGTIAPTSHTESGVTVTKWEARSGFLYDMMRGYLGWNYRRPRGVTTTYTEPYRFFDFDKYDHRSVSPMPTPPSGSRYISSAGQVTLLMDIPEDLAFGNMTLSTMKLPSGLVPTTPYLSTFYAGILLYRPNYSDCVWKTSTARIGTLSAQNTNRKVSFSSFKSIGVEGTAWNKMGTWYARTFLSTIQLSEGDNPTDIPNAVFIMADDEPTQLTFQNGTITNDLTITLQRAKWIPVAEGVPDQIRVTANVRNGFVYDATVTVLQMTVTSGLDTDPNPYVETYYFPLSEYGTIGQRDEQSFAHVFNNVPYEVGRVVFASFLCRATINGQSYSVSFNINLTPQNNSGETELT